MGGQIVIRFSLKEKFAYLWLAAFLPSFSFASTVARCTDARTGEEKEYTIQYATFEEGSLKLMVKDGAKIKVLATYGPDDSCRIKVWGDYYWP